MKTILQERNNSLQHSNLVHKFIRLSSVQKFQERKQDLENWNDSRMEPDES